MVVSPRLCRRTTPSRPTRTTRLDGSKTHRSVTSRDWPSEKVAVTRERDLVGRLGQHRPVAASRRAVAARAMPGGSGRQPAAIQRRRMSYSREPTAKRLPPSWGTAAVGFEENEAVFGMEPVGAAGERVAGEDGEVEVGVLAAEGELEAVLAVLVAVAGAGVAAAARQHGHDLVAEADRLGGAARPAPGRSVRRDRRSSERRGA